MQTPYFSWTETNKSKNCAQSSYNNFSEGNYEKNGMVYSTVVCSIYKKD